MRFIKLIVRLVLVVAVAIVLPLFASRPSEAMAHSGKRVVVVLREQRVYAYQGDTLLFSTRANIRGAKRGTFRVQNKIPVAKSTALGWKLPYWLGIYYVGRIQNGFHGYATTASGGRAGNSLGCVVMPTAAAARLYNWVSVGTPVTIQ